ncbi:MAG: zinc ribbon domain-containing protein [Promethearchaeota archaeon]
MPSKELKRKLSIGTIGLWVIFGIVSIVMAALVIGDVFTTDEIWIPIIPIGVVLVIAITASIIDFNSENKKRIGIIGIWAIFWITVIVMAALIVGEVFTIDEIWIPIIPVGTLFILSIVPTILEYGAGEVKYCPKCGRKFEKNRDYCQECGTSILMKCPSCGVKVKGNPKYCVKCGTNLSEVEVIHGSSTHVKFSVEGYTNTCEQCGAPAKPEAKYCVFCGALQ